MTKFSKFNLLKSYRDERDGNVSIMFAICLSAMCVLVGVAVDYSILTSKTQKLQDALDAATLFSAKVLDAQTFEADAQARLKDQIGDLSLKSMTSSFEVQGSNIVGTIKAEANLNFSGFFSKDTSNISVRSVVSLPASGGPCILLLDPNRNPALTLNSGAQVDASDCEVHVHSTANHAVMVNSGSSLETKRACIAGGLNVNSGGYIENEETGCTPMEDPYAGQIPVPNDTFCDFNGANYNGGNVRLTPGVYCGWYAFQGNGMNVEMDPGLYVLKNGGWSFNSGSVTGDGVTIYYGQNSNINFNSSINVDFKAPSSGAYAGFLMAESSGSNKSYLNLNDANGYDFEGILYLPNRNLTLNSGANVESGDLTIVANTLIVNDVNLSADSQGESGGDTNEVYISQ